MAFYKLQITRIIKNYNSIKNDDSLNMYIIKDSDNFYRENKITLIY